MPTRMLGVLFGLLAPIVLSFGCRKAEEIPYYQGYVEGEYVYVTASVAGELEELFVVRGATVQSDAPLFQLDTAPQALQIEEVEARIEQARAKTADLTKGSRPAELAIVEARLKRTHAALELAQRDFARRQELHAAGGTEAVSEEELDRFRTDLSLKQADVETVEAELETARLGGRSDAVIAAQKEVGVLVASIEPLAWQVAEKRVAAPANGIVQDTLFSVGEYVPIGRPVISLLPPENIKIRFFVPQAILPSLQLGDSVRAHLDGMDSRVPARISYISPVAEFTPPVIYSKESRTKLVFMVEAVPDRGVIDRLRPGQPLEVYLD